jgi:urease accessory protein
MNAGIMNLRLLQMSDSALPIGGYTHSWGLESAIADRTVRDAESLERWTLGWLKYALGPLEGVIVASACRATAAECWGQVATANELLTASLAPPSLRAASREMGEQLLGLASTWIWSAPAVASRPEPLVLTSSDSATNLSAIGIDIIRLGLMWLVNRCGEFDND